MGTTRKTKGGISVYVLLQAATAFFSVIGLFEAIRQIVLLFARKKIKQHRIRILIETTEETEPTFLAEDLRMLSSRLSACSDLQIRLICESGAKQEASCRKIANADESIQVISPSKALQEIDFFLQNK